METDLKSAKAKSKCLLFLASSYCAELEAVWNVVVTKWNTAGDGAFWDMANEQNYLLSTIFGQYFF